MNYKKLLATAVFTLGAWMSVGVAKADIPTYNATVNGTNYDFTYFTGTYNDYRISKFNTTYMPWWESRTLNTIAFADAVGNHLGFPNSNSTVGPYFASFIYDDNYSDLTVYASYYQLSGSSYNRSDLGMNQSFSYVTATVNSSGVAPEMDASLIPQVALLLACLFFLMGRKKHVVEPMLAA